MATMITDGGMVSGLPYVSPESPYIGSMGSPSGVTKWFMVTGVGMTPETIPPHADCIESFYRLTLNNWTNLVAFKLYIRRLPEDPDAPQVPIFEPTDDRLVFQVKAWKRDATYNTGGTTKETMALYSIVNTLCGIDGIEKVKINIDGNENPDFGGHFDLSEPLEADLSLIND